MGIGSGGNTRWPRRGRCSISRLDAEAIARKAMAIAAEICVYTNDNVGRSHRELSGSARKP